MNTQRIFARVPRLLITNAKLVIKHAYCACTKPTNLICGSLALLITRPANRWDSPFTPSGGYVIGCHSDQIIDSQGGRVHILLSWWPLPFDATLHQRSRNKIVNGFAYMYIILHSHFHVALIPSYSPQAITLTTYTEFTLEKVFNGQQNIRHENAWEKCTICLAVKVQKLAFTQRI